MIEDLERIIKKAAIDGTLTEEAAKQVQAALEENAKLKASVDSLDRERKTAHQKILELSAKVERFGREKDEVLDREKAVAEREAKMTELELTAKHEAQRVADHQAMFSAVFRNMQVRRTVFTPLPGVPYDNGMGPAVYPDVREDEQRETSE